MHFACSGMLTAAGEASGPLSGWGHSPLVGVGVWQSRTNLLVESEPLCLSRDGQSMCKVIGAHEISHASVICATMRTTIKALR